MILLRIVCDVNMKNLKILLLLPDVVARGGLGLSVRF